MVRYNDFSMSISKDGGESNLAVVRLQSSYWAVRLFPSLGGPFSPCQRGPGAVVPSNAVRFRAAITCRSVDQVWLCAALCIAVAAYHFEDNEVLERMCCD